MVVEKKRGRAHQQAVNKNTRLLTRAAPLLSVIKHFCQQHPASTYYIAYSGGLDSHVLLHLFAQAREALPITVRAIHVHHGLSVNADSWLRHCEKICDKLAIECVTRKVTIGTSNGDSLEEAARHKRYAVFADCLQAGDLLLTAHHQDDQAETLLLQLLRGAGVKGLSCMPDIKPLAQGLHARPLLTFSRQELLAYAYQEQLSWIEDESNLNKKFMRNFIRHELMPLMQQREPAASELLARSAAHCAETQGILDELAAHDLQLCAGSQPNTLSVQHLLSFSAARQRLLLRHWMHSRGFRLPDHRRLDSILRDVLTAEWDRLPCVQWGEVELRRYGDDLFLMKKLQEADVSFEAAWNLASPLIVPSVGKLDATQQNGVGFQRDVIELVVKLRVGGEVVSMPGRGSQTLKNLFQEWRVPPWQRDRIPLLYLNEKIISVVGYFLHPDYAVGNNELGWKVSVIPA